MIAVVLAVALAAGDARAFTPARLGPEPLRAHVDLGPIVIRTELANRDQFLRYLQLEGDRLRADGFFIAEGDPAAAAAPAMASSAWYANLRELAVVPMVLEGLTAKPRTATIVVHAYTFRDMPGTSRARLDELNAALMRGETSVASFEAERERILRGNS